MQHRLFVLALTLAFFMSHALTVLEQAAEIVAVEGPDDDDVALCRSIVSQLTIDEQEAVARSSYAYWLLATANQADDIARQRTAMREARRHLVGADGKVGVALESLKRAVALRSEYQMDLVRTCFTRRATEESLRYCELIRKDLQNQTMAVIGHDRENRAILLKLGRSSSETDELGYTLSQLYMAERAMAASEMLSRGTQDEIIGVFDFSGYSSAHSPPLSVVRRTVSALQQMYPERLHRLIILDAPFWMRAFYKVIHPFLSSKTQGKIVMVSGDSEKQAALSVLINDDRSAPLLSLNGMLATDVDMERLLFEVPFHSLYE